MVTSCATFNPQKASKKVIEGSYTIVKRETNLSNPNSIITGIVYDKESNNPIKGAVVQLEGIKKGDFTNEQGQFYLEIPEQGSFKVQVVNVGHTTISTEPIRFNSQTKTEINFYLGTAIEY